MDAVHQLCPAVLELVGGGLIGGGQRLFDLGRQVDCLTTQGDVISLELFGLHSGSLIADVNGLFLFGLRPALGFVKIRRGCRCRPRLSLATEVRLRPSGHGG